MRRSAIWFLIAGLWLVVAIAAAFRHGWQAAWLQAVIALLFFAVALYFRRREGVR
ncbi:MAG TPA: hypothetical protein VKX41_13430 [Alloacidobacterium sp.]|jgi:uncharacterized membrane protein|nr:hypothetical protein [Alloacidobacterium sp.]